MSANYASASAVRQTLKKICSFRLPELVTLGVYAAIVGFAIHFHEPWSDEAQAWEIASTLPLTSVFHVLRYEGSPGLWHLLLWCLNRLNVTYAGMHWFCGLLATASMGLLLLIAPFPRWLKLALPFTFFLAFQYAVVARSYVLAPISLFLLAALWKRRFERPIAVAVLLGLMANIALHLAVLSAGFAVCYYIELWRSHRRGESLNARRLKLAVALLTVFYACAVLTAWPAHDIAHPQGLSPLLPPQARQMEQHAKLRHGHSLAAIEYQFQQKLTAPLASGLVLPLFVALSFWGILAWALFKERKLMYLTPCALFAVFCHYVVCSPWHSGLIFPYVIAILWMTWPVNRPGFRLLARHEQLALVSLGFITIVQIYWAAYAIQFDRTHPYSPAIKTASFLKPYADHGARILETGNYFDVEALEPYFPKEIFANKATRYYLWSTRNGDKDDYLSMVQKKPDLVLVQWLGDGSTTLSPEAIDLIPEASQLVKLGYRNTNKFCGEMPIEGAAVFETHCELIFQP